MTFARSTSSDQPYETAVEACREALRAEGFGILTEIDLAATLTAKLGIEHEPYLILGACHPSSAKELIDNRPELGVLLPCNVTVSVEDGRTVIRAMDPEVALTAALGTGPGERAGDCAVREIAADIAQRLERAVARATQRESAAAGEGAAARSAALRTAADKRIELQQAVSLVEQVAASPWALPDWRMSLVAALEQLQIALGEHADEVEGERGLLAELLARAPRLANRIESVEAEHPVLASQITTAIDVVTGHDDVEEIRSTVLGTLLAIARHRQAGADLVYEAYDVDIGGQ